MWSQALAEAEGWKEYLTVDQHEYLKCELCYSKVCTPDHAVSRRHGGVDWLHGAAAYADMLGCVRGVGRGHQQGAAGSGHQQGAGPVPGAAWAPPPPAAGCPCAFAGCHQSTTPLAPPPPQPQDARAPSQGRKHELGDPNNGLEKATGDVDFYSLEAPIGAKDLGCMMIPKWCGETSKNAVPRMLRNECHACEQPAVNSCAHEVEGPGGPGKRLCVRPMCEDHTVWLDGLPWCSADCHGDGFYECEYQDLDGM
jgi:hypothetical protein